MARLANGYHRYSKQQLVENINLHKEKTNLSTAIKVKITIDEYIMMFLMKANLNIILFYKSCSVPINHYTFALLLFLKEVFPINHYTCLHY